MSSRAAGSDEPRAARTVLGEVAGYGLLAVSLYFFMRAIDFLSDRDYVAAIVAMFVGLFVSNVGSDLARLALWRSRR